MVASFWVGLPSWKRSAILLALAVGAWQAYVVWNVAGSDGVSLASPVETATAFWGGWLNGSLPRATRETMAALWLGVGIGTLIATALTLAAALTDVGDDLLRLVAATMNPVPGVALLPLALVLFEFSASAITFATAIATVCPIAINLTTGLRRASPTLLAVGRNIGLSKLRLATDVLVPAALPNGIRGFSCAWAAAWHTVLGAELVFAFAGAGRGLGASITAPEPGVFTPEMSAALLTIAMIGVVVDALFGVLERHTIARWGMDAETPHGRSGAVPRGGEDRRFLETRNPSAGDPEGAVEAARKLFRVV